MSLLWYIPLFPLIGVLINGFYGKRLGERTIGIIGSGMIGLSFITALFSVFQLLRLEPESRRIASTLFTWIQAGDFIIPAALVLDPLSSVMVLVVTGVAFFIHVYSMGYMHGDKGFYRFFTYLNLFVFSMLILVLADNFALMFIGWEGVGLCSYLLIGFWFEEKINSDAGKKAFIVNRIGDFGFLLAMFAIFTTFRTMQFDEVFAAAVLRYPEGGTVITAITLLLLVGAAGKSAQIPLYVWLPDAMQGPTPVSSLIHAATMVTAGVYMVARTNLLYMLSPVSMTVVAVIGVLTAIFAATIGILQNDIKRVLAYSTISQLGYMFLGCGVGAFSAGVFHLMTHAFFKGLLFLGAGSVMHAVANNTDMRFMGGLKKHMPRTYWTMLAATLAIAGIPGFAGFFSKDEILWNAFASPHGHWLLWVAGVLGAGITAFYMFRLIFMTFHGESRVPEEHAHHVHESPSVMTVPLIVLGIFSVIGGYIGVPIALGGSNHFEHFLHPVFAEAQRLVHAGAEDAHHSLSLEYLLMGTSVLVALLGIGLAYLLYLKNPAITEKAKASFGGLYNLVFNKYYVDEIYNAVIVKPIVLLAEFCWKILDVAGIDGAANGAGYLMSALSTKVRKIQTGFVQSYAFSILCGAVIIIGYFLFT